MYRLYNNELSRALHQPLYERIYKFCEKYSKELPPEAIVNSWLKRLYENDENLHVLIDLQNAKIVSHALIEVINVGNYKVVMCHQLEYDTKKTEPFEDCIKYVNDLVKQIFAYCSIFTVTKNVKVFEKKFGYENIRTTVFKKNPELVEENDVST